MDVNEAKAAHVNELMQTPGVVGVAVGKQGTADVILVLVESITPENDTPEKLGVPPVLEGYRVVITEAGRIEAQRETGRSERQ
jgi:hypothetical protein